MSKAADISSPASEAPILTFGEILPDCFIELVRPIDSVRPNLLPRNERGPALGPVIEHRGRRYEPCAIDDTVVRALNLHTNVGAFRSGRDLLLEICKAIDQFVALPERFTALLVRVFLPLGSLDHATLRA